MCREMKDSGIEWIGDIPKDWQVLKLRFLGETKSGLANKKPQDFGHGYPFISYKNVYKNMVLDSSYPDLVNSTELDRQNYNVLRGDTFFTASSETIEELGYASMCLEDIPNATYNGFVIRFRPYSFEYYNPNYMKYCFRSDVARGYLVQNDNSITRANLSQKTLKAMPIIIPNNYEQNKIANYLDRKVSQIDDIISNQESLIAKYKIYKQSLITETVTKGLNKNVPMKDSGIEWIGEIPSHWEIKSMKYLCSCNDDSLTNSEDKNMCINYVDISSVTFESGIVNYEEMLFKNAPSRARRVTQYGDIIISTVRTYLKAIAIIPDDKRYVVSTGFAVIRAKNILNRYLDYFIKSEYFINLVSLYSKGISYPAIDSFDLMNIKILEPSIDEQEEIANFLDKKCNAINLSITKKEQLIEKLESYKKSLIYECVTGKREVN